MGEWGSARASAVLAALLRIGWRVARQRGTHRVLMREGFPNLTFAGPLMVTVGGYDVVTGIITYMTGGTPACSNGGNFLGASRFAADEVRDWIEEMMGEPCHHFEVDGHPYLRCWD